MLAVSSPAWGEEWSVMVLGNPSRTAQTAFADSFHVADALKSAGFADVNLHRDLGGDGLAAVLDRGMGSSNVMIYFAGDTTQTALMGVDQNGAQLGPYLERLSQSGTQRVVLLVENCFANARANPVTLQAAFDMEVFAATSGDCATARLTDLIVDRTGDTTLQQLLSNATILMNSGAQIAMAAPARPQIIASAQTGPEIVDRIHNDVVSIMPMVAPATIQPVGFSQTAPPLSGQVGIQPSRQTPVILPAPRTTQQAALPLQNGLPEPSIVVGVIPGQDNFDTVDPNQPEIGTSEIAYDDLEARRAFRDQDPELFGSLVDGGAFDPPLAEMAVALQTELARMNCYRSRIDGDWGNISRGAVDRFFVQADGTPVSRDADAGLFRQVILQDDVQCPTPVVAQPQRPAPTPSPSAGQTRRPQPAAQPQPQVQPQPEPAPSGGGLGDVNLGGVFRG